MRDKYPKRSRAKSRRKTLGSSREIKRLSAVDSRHYADTSSTSNPTPLTAAERQHFFTLFQMVAPAATEEVEQRRLELEELLLTLEQRPLVDLRQVLQAIGAGCWAGRFEWQDGGLLDQFGEWLDDRDRLLRMVQQLPHDLEALYRRLGRLRSVLDKAGRLPPEPTLATTAGDTMLVLETLLVTMEQDVALQLRGTGRSRGRQPARAADQARTKLKGAGLSREQINRLLRIYGITRTTRSRSSSSL